MRSAEVHVLVTGDCLLTLHEERISTMRRRVGAEQAVFARVGVEIGALRGFDTHDESYFDRLYEQINRLLASIDAALNAMAMLLDCS